MIIFCKLVEHCNSVSSAGCLPTCIPICIQTCTCIPSHACVYIPICIHTCACIYLYEYRHARVYLYTYIHTGRHVYIYMHTYRHACVYQPILCHVITRHTSSYSSTIHDCAAALVWTANCSTWTLGGFANYEKRQILSQVCWCRCWPI